MQHSLSVEFYNVWYGHDEKVPNQPKTKRFTKPQLISEVKRSRSPITVLYLYNCKIPQGLAEIAPDLKSLVLKSVKGMDDGFR